MLACHIGQPQRQIGELGELPRFFRKGSKANRIDESFALVEARVKDIAEQFGGRRSPTFRSQHVEAERTAQLPVNINSEYPSVGRIVETIGDPLRVGLRGLSGVEIG